MDPIPEEAAKDPMGWAEKHIESLAPVAAKEVEYAMKFGSDERRYIAAKDALAMKGLTTKPKESGPVQQAMVFNVTGPVTAAGVPVLPFSNAPALTPSTAPVTVDTPTVKGDNDQAVPDPARTTK